METKIISTRQLEATHSAGVSSLRQASATVGQQPQHRSAIVTSVTTPQWKETVKRTASASSYRTPERGSKRSASSSKLMQLIQGPVLQTQSQQQLAQPQQCQQVVQSQMIRYPSNCSSSSTNQMMQQHKRTAQSSDYLLKKQQLTQQQQLQRSSDDDESLPKKTVVAQDRIVIADLIREVAEATTASVRQLPQSSQEEPQTIEKQQPQHNPHTKEATELGVETPAREAWLQQPLSIENYDHANDEGVPSRPMAAAGSSEIDSYSHQQIKLKQFEPVLLTNRNVLSKSPAHPRTPSRQFSNIGSTTPQARRGMSGKVATTQWNVNTPNYKSGPALSKVNNNTEVQVGKTLSIEVESYKNRSSVQQLKQQQTRSISDLQDLAIKIAPQDDPIQKKQQQSLTDKRHASQMKQMPQTLAKPVITSSAKPFNLSSYAKRTLVETSGASKKKLTGRQHSSSQLSKAGATRGGLASTQKVQKANSRYSGVQAATAAKKSQQQVDSTAMHKMSKDQHMKKAQPQPQLDLLQPAQIQIEVKQMQQMSTSERAQVPISETTANIQHDDDDGTGKSGVAHSTPIQVLQCGPPSCQSFYRVDNKKSPAAYDTIEKVTVEENNNNFSPYKLISSVKSKEIVDQDSAEPASIQQRAQSALETEHYITLEELYTESNNYILKSPSMPTLQPIAEALPTTPNRMSFMRPTISSRIKKEMSAASLNQKIKERIEEAELDKANNPIVIHNGQGGTNLVSPCTSRENNTTPNHMRGKAATATRHMTPKTTRSCNNGSEAGIVAGTAHMTPKRPTSALTTTNREQKNINYQQRGSCTNTTKTLPKQQPSQVEQATHHHLRSGHNHHQSPRSAAVTPMRHNHLQTEPLQQHSSTTTTNQRALLHNMIISSAATGSTSNQGGSSIKKAALIYENPADILVHNARNHQQPPSKVSMVQSPQKGQAHQLTGNYYHQVLKGGTQMYTKTAKAAIKRHKSKQMQVRGSQPPFVGTVNRQTAGQISKQAKEDEEMEFIEADEKTVGANIHLQAILDEVSHIEKQYPHAGSTVNQRATALAAPLSMQDNLDQQHNLAQVGTIDQRNRGSKDSLKNLMTTADIMPSQQFVVHNCRHGGNSGTTHQSNSVNPYNVQQSAQYKAHMNMAGRIFNDSTSGGQQRKGATQNNWHRHQNSMKSTQTTVTSPRKQSISRPRNGQSKQKSANANSSNVYCSKGGNGNGYSQQHRKSLNFPSKSLNRKNTLLSSTEESQAVVDIAPSMAGHHHRTGGSEMINQDQKSSRAIKLDSVEEKQRMSGRGGGPASATANTGKNFNSYRVSNLSNEASRRIQTDQEHFGTFMISVNKRNQIDSAGGQQSSKNAIANGYSSAGDPTHTDLVPSIDTRLGSMNLQQNPSSIQVDQTKERLRGCPSNDGKIADCSPIHIYSNREHYQRHETIAAIGSESNLAFLRKKDKVPKPESCLSPDIPSLTSKQLAVDDYNRESIDRQASAVLQDIQRGQKKLGRTLKCDSALGLLSYTNGASTNLENVNKLAIDADNMSQPTSIFNQGGKNRPYVPLDKRVSAAATKSSSFQASRASKSPIPTKKGSVQQSANQQKQSLKQLGLSYGLLMKQDGQVVQNHQPVTKPTKKRLTGHLKDTSPMKKASKLKSQTHVEDIYKINAPPESNDNAEEANQVTYDEQTTLSPMQSATNAINKARYVAKSQYGRITSSELSKGNNISSAVSPARFNQTVKKPQAQNHQQLVLQQMAQNQLIMKRMPELSIAPTVSSLGSVQNHFLPQTQRGRLFKYQVFSGNNQQLVRRVMNETRSYLWTEMQNTQQSHFHFRWAPVSRQVNFDRLSHNFGQIVNHFEHHHEVTTKNELFKNLKAFNDEKNQNAFHTIPLTFYLKVSADRQAQSIKQQIKPFKEVFNLLEEFKDQFDPDVPTLQRQQPQQQDDETPGMTTTPNTAHHEQSIDSTVTKMEQLRDYDKLCQTALSVFITKKGQEMGYRDFKSNAQGEVNSRVKKFTSKSSGLTMPMSHFAGQNIWILKPTGFNRGKGIHVVNSISKLKKLVKEYSRTKESGTGGVSGVTTSIANSTLYPTSKFMEPQALSTQQLMNVTLQAAASTNNQIAPFSNLAMSTTKHSRQNLTNSTMPRFVKPGDALAIDASLGMRAGSPTKLGTKKASSKVQSSVDHLSSEKVDEAAPSPTIKAGGAGVVTARETETITATVEKQTLQTNIAKGTEQFPVKHQPVLLKEKVEVKEQVAASKPSGGYQKTSIRTQAFIIQKYIERPLLINQRKFDIRVWVTATQDMEIYFFKEGYLRTSSQPYNMTAANLDNDFIHLTNNDIQKNSPEYGCHEDGNMLSFADFQKLLVKGGAPVNFEDLVTKMKYHCAQTLVSIRKKLNPNRRKHCFELFGFDFFIDVDYNVWLIEVNTNPCILESSKILQTLLPRMLDDLFKLTIDQIFLPTKDLMQQMAPSVNQISHGKSATEKQFYNVSTGKSQYKVSGYKDSFNMWERIGTMKQNAANPIYLADPYEKQVSRSDKIIHLVNQHELRVAKPDLIEKGIKRDKLQSGTTQLSGFIDY